jgi:hypothetical protein
MVASQDQQQRKGVGILGQKVADFRDINHDPAATAEPDISLAQALATIRSTSSSGSG